MSFWRARQHVIRVSLARSSFTGGRQFSSNLSLSSSARRRLTNIGFGLILLGGAGHARRQFAQDDQSVQNSKRTVADDEKREQKTLARLYAGKASFTRLLQIIMHMLPLAFLWPIWLINPLTFWAIVAAQLERCGPCFVKLAQWLATRRDILPDEICISLGRLHDNVASAGSLGYCPKEIAATLIAVDVRIKDIDPKPHASGSIAEVYFARLEDGTSVAIKCMRPGVRPLIDGDLTWILRLAALADNHPLLRMYGLRRAAELFCNQLQMQTDFAIEARNLQQFQSNFAGQNEVIKFPIPLHVTDDLLVLSREEGIEISRIFRDADAAGAANLGSAEARAEALQRHLGISSKVCAQIATESIACYMRMLFKDQFVHGDLHPGNVLLRMHGRHQAPTANCNVPLPQGLGQGDQARDLEVGQEMRDLLPWPVSSVADLVMPRRLPFDLVILDAGLAVPVSPEKVEALRGVVTAILYADYAKASQRTFDESPDSTCCERPDVFQSELSAIFRDSRRAVWENGFLQLSNAGLQCLDLARRHHVHLDVTLSWAILAMLSVEGTSRQLHPHVDCSGTATRYIVTLKSLLQELHDGSWISAKEMVVQMAMETCGLDFWAFRNWRLKSWNEQTHGKIGAT